MLSGVGSHMNKNWLAFDPHNFGYAKLDDLVIASELFELRRDTRLRARVWVSESGAVSYTHLRAHETVLDLVCRLLLEKKKHADLSFSNFVVLCAHH